MCFFSAKRRGFSWFFAVNHARIPRGKRAFFVLKKCIFVCNRKFTFYPLQIHMQVVHYHQSKDIDEQTPNITSHPIPIKSAYGSGRF